MVIKISISNKDLTELVIRQINSLFGFDSKNELDDLSNSIKQSLKKIEYCFAFSRNKYYRKDNEVYFNPFHSGQYCIFLYCLSNILSKGGEKALADKVYYLNKALNCVDLYHEVNLPKIFGLDHPVGSVIGKATFSDLFFFTQNTTVGNNHGIYPSFGENVALLAGATVVGNCHIGNNCIISARTYIKDQDIPSNSIVFGTSPDLIIKQEEESYFWENGMFSLKDIS